jgi:MFS transporter, PPP family, 3-phenylpropionic acid transporter
VSGRYHGHAPGELEADPADHKNVVLPTYRGPSFRPTCKRGCVHKCFLTPNSSAIFALIKPHCIPFCVGEALLSMADSVIHGDNDEKSKTPPSAADVKKKADPAIIQPPGGNYESSSSTTEESSSSSEEDEEKELDSFLPNDDRRSAALTAAADAEPLIRPRAAPFPKSSIDNDADGAGPTLSRGIFFFQCLYFLNGLSASTWGRFSVIYYNQVAHMTPEQMGVLQAVAPLISLVLMPFWGGLADHLHSRKVVYLWCKALGTISLMSLAFLPQPPSFGPILLCVAGVAVFRASGILDAYVLDYLGAHDQRDRYGEIRVWTAISWGLGAIGMGYVTDYLNFNWNFALYGTMMTIMGVIVAVALPARSTSEQERYDRLAAAAESAATTTTINDLDHPHDRPALRSLYTALVRPPIIWWIFEVSVIGCGMAVVESFLFVYLQNDLAASTRLCGWTVGVTVLCEIPIFAYSKRCLQYVGHDALFCIALLAYCTRVYGYTYLTVATVRYVLALEILHGVTFACMWIASIDFSAQIAPPEWSNTVQSILSAAFTCFGSIVGPLIGGYILQSYSAATLFRGMAVLVAVVLVAHGLAWQVGGHGHGAFLKSIITTKQENRTSSVALMTIKETDDDNDDDEPPLPA